MIDIISGDEPHFHVDEEPSVNFGAPHLKWFLTAIVLQLTVLLGLAAPKMDAMQSTPSLTLEAPVSICHDRFRGSYVNAVNLSVDEVPSSGAPPNSDQFVVFKQSGADSKFVRIDFKAPHAHGDEIAIKARPYSLHTIGKESHVSIDTEPYFLSEDLTKKLRNGETATIDLSIDKNGKASITDVND